MKYCPNCGRAEVEGMKFCPRCGQKLTDFGLEEKQRYTHQPEVPLKKRSWFERHLNWTMVLAWAGTYLVTFIVASLVILVNPYVSGYTLYAILVIANLAIVVPVGRWVLKRKNRSMWWLLLCMGILFLFIGNKSPIADCDKAIELNPSNADAYLNRANAYVEVGECDKAILDYSKAIELNPRHALAFFNRAYAYGEIGDYDKAIADYSKAIELNPNDAQAYYNRALDYCNKGEVLTAVSDLEKCLALSTDPELTKDARQALGEIRTST